MATNSIEKAEFDSLVKKYKSIIYSICFMFADTKMQADDLFQEVLINLWKGFNTFRGDASLQSWVYRVSMNTCMSYNRMRKGNKRA